MIRGNLSILSSFNEALYNGDLMDSKLSHLFDTVNEFIGKLEFARDHMPILSRTVSKWNEAIAVFKSFNDNVIKFKETYSSELQKKFDTGRRNAVYESLLNDQIFNIVSHNVYILSQYEKEIKESNEIMSFIAEASDGLNSKTKLDYLFLPNIDFSIICHEYVTCEKDLSHFNVLLRNIYKYSTAIWDLYFFEDMSYDDFAREVTLVLDELKKNQELRSVKFQLDFISKSLMRFHNIFHAVYKNAMIIKNRSGIYDRFLQLVIEQLDQENEGASELEKKKLNRDRKIAMKKITQVIGKKYQQTGAMGPKIKELMDTFGTTINLL